MVNITDNAVSAEKAKKLRKTIRLRAVRSFGFYFLQTLGLLTTAFTILSLVNNFLSPDNFIPKPGTYTINSNITVNALLGTIGSLRCGITGLVIGTVAGAISGAIGYKDKAYKADTEAERTANLVHNIYLLIKIIEIQILVIVGLAILAPLMLLIKSRYNTRFFIIYEQILWLYSLYLTIAYAPRNVIFIVVFLYTARIIWRLLLLSGVWYRPQD